MSNLLLAGAPADPVAPTIDVDGHAVPALLAVGCRFDFEVPQTVHAVVIVEPHESEGGRVVEECFTAPDGVTTLDLSRRVRQPVPAAGAAGGPRHVLVPRRRSRTTPGSTPSTPAPSRRPRGCCPTTCWGSSSRAASARPTSWHRWRGSASARSTRGWARVESIVSWVNEHLTFRYGASSPTMSAADAYANRAGVCRDFAHLAITMCRALSIPARYVVGYLPDIAVPDPGTPMDFCAWTEIYVGDRWYTFDPRNHGQRRIGRTVIGRGRDAADVAMTTTFGPATLLDMQVTAEASPRPDDGARP